MIETYTFRGQFNYTIGGANQFYADALDNVRINLTAWHDGGLDPSAPGVGDDNRVKTFSALWNEGAVIGADTAALTYPVGVTGEFTLVDAGIEQIGLTDNYYVYFNITFNSQTRAAAGDGVAWDIPGGPVWDINALNDINSWNFRFDIFDQNFQTASNQTYGEFGVFRNTDVVVSGDPSGSAPPGTLNVELFPYSNITYSANTPYYVNVSISDLTFGANIILATQVDLQHVNITGQRNFTNSQLHNRTSITGADAEVGVWGNYTGGAGMLQVLPAPCNGTTTNGEWGSDFNLAIAIQDTQVRWWIDVPGGIAEGTYEATITVTLGFY